MQFFPLRAIGCKVHRNLFDTKLDYTDGAMACANLHLSAPTGLKDFGLWQLGKNLGIQTSRADIHSDDGD